MNSPAAQKPRLAPQLIERLKLAGQSFRAGNYAAAAAAYEEVIRQAPKLPDVHSNLGLCLKAMGKLKDAVRCFKRAVRLAPDYVQAYLNLGSTYELTGQTAEAVEMLVDARRKAPESAQIVEVLVRVLNRHSFEKPLAAARTALGSLVTDSRVEWELLSGPIVALWSAHPGVRKALEAAEQAYPAHAAGSEFRVISNFFPDPLMLLALRNTVIASPKLEAMMQQSRRQALSLLCSGQELDWAEDWLVGLALQARLTGWVWPLDRSEKADLRTLDLDMRQMVGTTAPDWKALKVRALVRALYQPLESDPCAEDWRQDLATLGNDEGAWAELLRRSFTEPETEARLSEDIKALTPVEDDTSLKVRLQYEEQPYPRWLSIAARSPRTVPEHLERVLGSGAGKGIPYSPAKILVAGCGTGRHAIQTALRYEECEVTAVDLSRRSLSYAMRRAREMKVANIDFAQADILALGEAPELEAPFDIIESSGVLHHLADPVVGWRVLCGLLKQGGLMRLAFYSARAREGYAEIGGAARKAGTLPEQISAARQGVFDAPAGHPVRILLETPDFYSSPGVRDALLHECEHQVDPLWIKDRLAELDLGFLGFELPDARYLELYRKEGGKDARGLDLEIWERVEAQNPQMFIGMYQFWVRAT